MAAQDLQLDLIGADQRNGRQMPVAAELRAQHAGGHPILLDLAGRDGRDRDENAARAGRAMIGAHQRNVAIAEEPAGIAVLQLGNAT
ncbi:hypothetical protein D3C87_1987080 [compost metagenome]